MELFKMAVFTEEPKPNEFIRGLFLRLRKIKRVLQNLMNGLILFCTGNTKYQKNITRHI